MIWLKGISNLVGLESGLVIDMIVPIAMVSLGVDFAIHAMRRYAEEKENGYSPRRALTVGMAGVLGALALAAATDSVAFLANVSSEIEVVIHFGIAATIATVSAFLVLGVVAPVVMMHLDRLAGGARTHVQQGRSHRGRSIGRHIASGLAAGMTGMAVIFIIAPVTGLEVSDISLDPVIGIVLIAVYIVIGIVLPVGMTA